MHAPIRRAIWDKLSPIYHSAFRQDCGSLGAIRVMRETILRHGIAAVRVGIWQDRDPVAGPPRQPQMIRAPPPFPLRRHRPFGPGLPAVPVAVRPSGGQTPSVLPKSLAKESFFIGGKLGYS